MAQRAKIGINGDPLGFDELLDRLQTSGIGGGSVTWLPEADTRCETLNVTANGTYSAAEAGKYGYDYVVVSVPGSSVTGRDPDTGEEVVVRPDPETGEITETVVPVEIRVIEPPTKISYVDGETIITDGMVVKAYDALGVEMLTVPIGEITLNPATAIFNEREYAIWVSSDFNIMPNPFQMGSLDSVSAWSVGGGAYRRIENHVSMSGALKRLGGSTGDQIMASDSPFSATVMTLTYYVSKEEAEGHTVEEIARSNLGTLINDNVYTVDDNNSYTYGGRTVYYYAGGVSLNYYYDIEPIQAGNTGQIAWAMVYGDKTEGAPQTITVSWPRPGDGAVLETAFDIQVTPAGGDTP